MVTSLCGSLPCLAAGATELGDSWGVAVLCPLGTGPSGFPFTAARGLRDVPRGLGCLEDSLPAGPEELVGCCSRQASHTPATSCVRLSVLCCGAVLLPPCVPSFPVQLLAALLSLQALHGRGSLAACKVPCSRGPCLRRQRAAHKEKFMHCQDHLLVCSFSFWQFYDLNSSTFLWSSRAGHTNAGINSVRRGGGATRGSLMGLGSPCWCHEPSGAGHFGKSRAPTQANKLSGL